jgi:hypothetical protein
MGTAGIGRQVFFFKIVPYLFHTRARLGYMGTTGTSTRIFFFLCFCFFFYFFSAGTGTCFNLM